MTDRVVTSFDDLHQIVQGYGKKTIIYRGATRTDHELIPDVGRYNVFTPSDVKKREKRILKLFKEQAVPHLTFRPRTDWEWLAIARHHGLPTRLLDWSRNPLVAGRVARTKDREAVGCPRFGF